MTCAGKSWLAGVSKLLVEWMHVCVAGCLCLLTSQSSSSQRDMACRILIQNALCVQTNAMSRWRLCRSAELGSIRN